MKLPKGDERIGKCLDCHIVGALCRVCAGKFLERNHRTVIPSVYHYYRRFRIAFYGSGLTLSPVMCSLILKPDSGKKKNIVFRKINEWLNLGNHKYVAVINRVIRNPRRLMSAFGLVLVAIFIIHRLVPTSFLPVEDQGYFKIELELPEGATLERTRVVTDRAVQYLEKNPMWPMCRT